MSVKSPLGLVLYCYLNMPTINKTYLILSYLILSTRSCIPFKAVFERKLEKKYAPALDNYGQSCFVRSDF